jgi:hypothetical protein
VRRGEPKYDLGEVVRLVRCGRVLLTRRVAAWLANHEYDAGTLVVLVLKRLPTHARWLGSCVLANSMSADEYVASLDDVEWYVKFYVDEVAGGVVVWSCWWQGSAH